MKKNVAQYVFQLSITGIFGYFGVLALMNPEIEAAKWVSVSITGFIETVIPVRIFILALGVTQVVTALLLITNKLTRIALPLAALLLLGIIVNLLIQGIYEIALRDIVILMGVIYLYFSQHRITAIKDDLAD